MMIRHRLTGVTATTPKDSFDNLLNTFNTLTIKKLESGNLCRFYLEIIKMASMAHCTWCECSLNERLTLGRG